MNKSTTLLLGVMLCITPPCYAKKVYKQTDAKGNTYYSDAPTDGATEIVLPPVQTFSEPVPTASANEPADEQKTPISYEVGIIEPTNEFTVPMGQETLDIKLFIKPELAPEDDIKIVLDDKNIESPLNELSMRLDNLERGTHVLKVVIVNKKDNKIIKEGESVTFHVQRQKLSTSHPKRSL